MLKVYTDGSCVSAQGGWAWIVSESLYGYGQASGTTSNRMEIQAALEAMRALSGHDLVVVSDSQYMLKCGFGTWARKKNRDLWQEWDEVLDLRSSRKTSGEWVKGHSGVRLNEAADRLAEIGRRDLDLTPYLR